MGGGGRHLRRRYQLDADRHLPVGSDDRRAHLHLQRSRRGGDLRHGYSGSRRRRHQPAHRHGRFGSRVPLAAESQDARGERGSGGHGQLRSGSDGDLDLSDQQRAGQRPGRWQHCRRHPGSRGRHRRPHLPAARRADGGRLGPDLHRYLQRYRCLRQLHGRRGGDPGPPRPG